MTPPAIYSQMAQEEKKKRYEQREKGETENPGVCKCGETLTAGEVQMKGLTDVHCNSLQFPLK